MGQIKPFFSADINFTNWGLPLNNVSPYIDMSDRLVLYPNSKVSTTVWDMEDNRNVGVLEGHTARVVSAKINDVRNMAVTIAGGPGDVEPLSANIWSLGTLQCTANMTSNSYTSSLLEDRLLLGSSDGSMKVWDIGSSAPIALMNLTSEDDYINLICSLTASDTANVALSGYIDNDMRLWDLRTGQCVRGMEGHASFVGSVSMDSACQIAVSGSHDETAKLWDLGSGRCIDSFQFDCHVHSVVMHESGGSFLAASGNVFFHACSTAFNDAVLCDVDLRSMCVSERDDFPRAAASKDLSRVGLCRKKSNEELGVSVWK